MFIHDGLEYGGPLAAIGETKISDEEIRLRCLDYATRDIKNPDPLFFAKAMYLWVKEESVKAQPDGEKWNIKTNEVKYSYDLTGCAGNSKTVVDEESKE